MAAAWRKLLQLQQTKLYQLMSSTAANVILGPFLNVSMSHWWM